MIYKYRDICNIENLSLQSYEVIYKETSLLIKSSKNYSTEVLKYLISIRKPIEKYIKKNPEFYTSLKPFSPSSSAPKIVKYLCEVTNKVGVGPMSAIAGTIAEFIGKRLVYKTLSEGLSQNQQDLIIENGGDIFTYLSSPITVGIYAGEKSPFSYKLGIKINLLNQQLGICTSSGTVGHSLSFGTADAVTIISPSAAFSDALATATGNIVKTEKDLPQATKFAKLFPETLFVIIIKGQKISCWTKNNCFELVKT